MPWQAELPLTNDKPLAADETPRTIALGERIVPYVLRRARRRSIGLSIDHRGLRVGAPSGAIAARSRIADPAARRMGRRKNSTNGARRPARNRCRSSMACSCRCSAARSNPPGRGANRCVWNLKRPNARSPCACARPMTPPRVLEKGAARKGARAVRRAPGPLRRGSASPCRALTLSAARTRWGSCSLRSGIRLNWRLIHFPLPVIDYVAVHELAHLREMNHSARFWSIVAQVYPDYPNARKALQLGATHCPHW